MFYKTHVCLWVMVGEVEEIPLEGIRDWEEVQRKERIDSSQIVNHGWKHRQAGRNSRKVSFYISFVNPIFLVLPYNLR